MLPSREDLVASAEEAETLAARAKDKDERLHWVTLAGTFRKQLEGQSRDKLNLAKHHVRDSKRHIARQERVIQELKQKGHSVEQAQSLLRLFKETFKTHQEGLACINAAIQDYPVRNA